MRFTIYLVCLLAFIARESNQAWKGRLLKLIRAPSFNNSAQIKSLLPFRRAKSDVSEIQPKRVLDSPEEDLYNTKRIARVLSDYKANEFLSERLPEGNPNIKRFHHALSKFMRQRDGIPDSEYRNITISLPIVSRGPLDFLIEVTIGSEKQKLNLLLDTNSTTTWLIGNHSLSEAVIQKRKLDRSVSHYSSERFKAIFNYGGNHIDATLATDELHFSACEEKPRVPFMEANTFYSNVETSPFTQYDGVLGMDINGRFLRSLIYQMFIDIGVFSICFDHEMYSRKVSGDSSSQVGELILGSRYYTCKHDIPIIWSQLREELGGKKEEVLEDSLPFEGPMKGRIENEKGQKWKILVEDVGWSVENPSNYFERSRGPSNYLSVCQSGCETLVHPGTYGIVAPREKADQLNQKIGAKRVHDGQYVIENCKEQHSNLPYLSITIRKHKFRLSPAQYLRPVDSRGNECYSGIRAGAGKDWILGDIFIMNHLVIFDAEKKYIGIAKLKVQASGLRALTD